MVRGVSVAVDRLIHEPTRLAIMTNLFAVESASATDLFQQTQLTWATWGHTSSGSKKRAA